METVIVTGISGAGKSRAADMLEDLDFYCIDNMPAVMIPRFAELCLSTRGRYERVALVSHVHGAQGFDELFQGLDKLQELGQPYQILFVEASVETLVRRYKETRRRHPLDPNGRNLEEAIRGEKRALMPVRDRADFILDTSTLTLGQLQRKLFHLFAPRQENDASIHVNVVAFGFKHGIPLDSDLVFDVRYLPNPFYIEHLRPLTGLDTSVAEHVLQHASAVEFMAHLKSMIDFLLPLYIEEGKRTLTLSIGCTGGRHRSVALAARLNEHLQTAGYDAELVMRNLVK